MLLDHREARVSDGPVQHRPPVLFRSMAWCSSLRFESRWLFLSLLGAGMALVAWAIDVCIESITEWRLNLARLHLHRTGIEDNAYTRWAFALPSFQAYLLWVAFTVVLLLLTVLVVDQLAPIAAGAGVEHVRSILTGYDVPGYLDAKTLLAKVIGVTLVQGAGLAVGRDGPFVHISCCLANQMLKIPIFKDIRENRALTKQVLAAACAAGVASTFGAPVGGVLFSIETSTSVIHTSDYWMAFFCAVCGEVVFRALAYFGVARAGSIALYPTSFDAVPFQTVELPLFALLSAICGFLGGFFVRLILAVRDARLKILAHAESQTHLPEPADASDPPSPGSGGGVRAWLLTKIPWPESSLCVVRVLLRPLFYTFLVAVVSSSIDWMTGEFMRRSLYQSLEDFLAEGRMTPDLNDGTPLDDSVHSRDWGTPSFVFNLVLFIFVKGFLILIALSLPVPAGWFLPLSAVGLAVGRLFGEFCFALGGSSFSPGIYALVGQASFVAGATGAVSTALIIFEITTSLSAMVPVLLGVVLGRSAGRVVSLDLVAALQKSGKLPSIPTVNHQSSYAIRAGEIMEDSVLWVDAKSVRADVHIALRAMSFNHMSADDDLFALLQSGVYMGCVTRAQLSELLERREEQELDILALCDVNRVAPSVPTNTSMSDVLSLFEATLSPVLFVTERSRVVGCISLKSLRRWCDKGYL